MCIWTHPIPQDLVWASISWCRYWRPAPAAGTGGSPRWLSKWRWLKGTSVGEVLVLDTLNQCLCGLKTTHCTRMKCATRKESLRAAHEWWLSAHIASSCWENGDRYYLFISDSEQLILKMYEKSDWNAYLWHKKITIISAVNAIERAEPMYEM